MGYWKNFLGYFGFNQDQPQNNCKPCADNNKRIKTMWTHIQPVLDSFIEIDRTPGEQVLDSDASGCCQDCQENSDQVNKLWKEVAIILNEQKKIQEKIEKVQEDLSKKV